MAVVLVEGDEIHGHVHGGKGIGLVGLAMTLDIDSLQMEARSALAAYATAGAR
jgi:hypothetical protein